MAHRSRPRPADPRKSAVWQRRLQRFAASRTTVSTFCDRAGVRYGLDALFKQIYREDRFAVMQAANSPLLIELWGPRELRLSRLQLAIDTVSKCLQRRSSE